MNGALLINKHPDVSSFGIIELLKKQSANPRDVPKLGHGGTLDPFATGLLVVLVGRAVKLARYFLGASKAYQGTMRFGETTIPGDPTDPISESCTHLPSSLSELQDLAHRLTLQPYFQIPPMHSAKKKNGTPLYMLARAGLEVERDPKLCYLFEFNVSSYVAPRADFNLKCSSGTYIRTLAQDFGRLLKSLALLESLHRTSSGKFSVENAWTVEKIAEATQSGKKWDELPCWVPFDRLLDGHHRAEATFFEKQELFEGRQTVLLDILKRMRSSSASPESAQEDPLSPSSGEESRIAIYCSDALIGIAHKEQNIWNIEKIFKPS